VHISHVLGSIFHCESNETIFKILRSHLHGVGGQIDEGQGGAHYVGGGFVRAIRSTCIKPIF
jgi:hypothetical protein